MAYYSPNTQRRYYSRTGTSSTTNLLGSTVSRTTSNGSTASAARMNRIPSLSVAPSVSDKAGFWHFSFVDVRRCLEGASLT